MKLALTIWLLLFGSFFLSGCSNNKPFNSEVWLKADQRVRGQMANRLKNDRILEGKSRPEVIAMLGNPDWEDSEVVIYQVDLGHKFASSPWLYQLNVTFEGRMAIARRS